MEKRAIIVRVPAKKRNKTERCMMQDMRCNERMKRNSDLFNTVKKILNAYFKGKLLIKDMLSLANEISQCSDVTPIDRDAKRRKDALICWFAENWGKTVDFLVKQKKCIKRNSETSNDIDDIAFSYDFDVFNEPNI